jgi:hypothetical protein
MFNWWYGKNNSQDPNLASQQQQQLSTQPQAAQFGLPQQGVPYSASQPNPHFNVKRRPTSAENKSNEQDLILENKRQKLNTGQARPIVSDQPLPTVERLTQQRARPAGPPSQGSQLESIVESQNDNDEYKAFMQGFKNIKQSTQYWPALLGDKDNFDFPRKQIQYWRDFANAKANGLPANIDLARRQLTPKIRQLKFFDETLMNKGEKIPPLNQALVTYMNLVLGPEELRNQLETLPREQWEVQYNRAQQIGQNLSSQTPPNLVETPSTYDIEPPESFQQNTQNISLPNLTQTPSTQPLSQVPSSYQIESQQPSDVEQQSQGASTIASNLSFPNVQSQQASNIEQQSQGASTMASNLSFPNTQSQQPPSVQQQSQGASTIASNLSFPNVQSQQASNVEQQSQGASTMASNLSFQNPNVSQMSYNPNAPFISSTGKATGSQDSGNYDDMKNVLEETYGDISQLSETYGPFPKNKDQEDINISQLQEDDLPDYKDQNYVEMKESQSTIPTDIESQQQSQTQPISSQGSIINPTLPYTQSQGTVVDIGLTPNLTQQDSGISANVTQADSGISNLSGQTTQSLSQTIPMSNQSTITDVSGQTTQTQSQPLSSQTTQTESLPASSQTTITNTPPSSYASSGQTTQTESLPASSQTTQTETQPSSMGSTSTQIQSQDTNPSLASTQQYSYDPYRDEEEEMKAFNNENRPFTQMYQRPDTSSTGTSGTSSSAQSLGQTQMLSQADYNISKQEPFTPIRPDIVSENKHLFYKKYILPDPTDIPQLEREIFNQLILYKKYNKYRLDNQEPTSNIDLDTFEGLVWRLGAPAVKRIFLQAGLNENRFMRRIDAAAEKISKKGSQENIELKQSETSTAPNQPPAKSGIPMPPLEKGTTMQSLQEPFKVEDVEMAPSAEELKEEKLDIVNGEIKLIAKRIQKLIKEQDRSIKHQFPAVTLDSEKEINYWLSKFRERLRENPDDEKNMQKLNVIPEIIRMENEAVREELHRIENDPNPSKLDLRLREVLADPDATTEIKFPYLRMFQPEDVFDPSKVKAKYKEYMHSRLAKTAEDLPEVKQQKQKHEDMVKEYKEATGEDFKEDDNYELSDRLAWIRRNLKSEKLKSIEETNKKMWTQFPSSDLEKVGMTPDKFKELKANLKENPPNFKKFLENWDQGTKNYMRSLLEKQKNRVAEIAKREQLEDTFQNAFTKNSPEDSDSANTLMQKYEYWKDFEKDPAFQNNRKKIQELNKEYDELKDNYYKLTGKTVPNPPVTGLEKTKQRNDFLKRQVENFKTQEQYSTHLEDALRNKYKEVKHLFDNITHDLYKQPGVSEKINRHKKDPETFIAWAKNAFRSPMERKEQLEKRLDELIETTNIIDKSERQYQDSQIQNLQNLYDEEYKNVLRYNPMYKRIDTNVGKNVNEAKENIAKLQNESKQNEEIHGQLYKDVVAVKQVLEQASSYSDRLSEKDIYSMNNAQLKQLKDKLETEATKLKTNMGTYSKTQMVNHIRKLRNQMKEIDPNSVPIEPDEKYFQTMSEEKVQNLLDQDVDKFKELQDKKQDAIQRALTSVDDSWVYYRILQKQKRFSDYKPVPKEDVWNIKSLSELENFAHRASTVAKQGKIYSDDVQEEFAEKNKAEIKKSQTELQQQHEINMEKGRQWYGNLQADKERDNKTFNATLHTLDTTMNNIQKSMQHTNQMGHEKTLEKSKQLTTLFIENKKDMLKRTELQDKKAMHLIDSNLKKSEMQLKHEDILNNQLLKVSMQEGDQQFQKDLQTNKFTQDSAEAKLERDFKTNLENAKNNTDVIKALIDYDLKGNQIIKHRGLQDRKTELVKQMGDRAMESIKDLNKRGILNREHNHAKEILNIQQQFQGRQAENEQELKQMQFEEKVELDKYLNRQVLRSKQQMQSGEHRFKFQMHGIEQKEKEEEEGKKIAAAERYISAIIPELQELNIPFKMPADIVSKEDADQQIKYFSDLKEKARDIPFERKKLEQLAERAKRIPDSIKEELELWIPHRDDINKMDYDRIKEVKKELQDAFQNNKIDELELGKQRENALKLNKYIDDINSMAGDRIYHNIDLKSAPKNIEELDVAERMYKEKYEQVRADLKLANTQKASLYTEIEEIRKELGPGQKHLIPKLTEYKNFESQKNNLYSGNLELVQKQVQELGKILRQAHAAQRYDSEGKHAENTLDTYVSGLRSIAGDPTTFYKLLQNAASGRDVYRNLSVDPIAANQLIHNSQQIFEKVASNSFLKNLGRKNEHEVGLIIDAAKQMYESSGLSKELGAKWEDIEQSLDYESPYRKAATVDMLAKSAPLSEMYLVNLAVDLKSNPTAVNYENPVKLYTAMKSMGVTVDMSKITEKNPAGINRQILDQIPEHLLGETTAKKFATEEEMNMRSWLRQTKNVDTYSENWVGENLLTGDTRTEALKSILDNPNYSKGAPISKLDFGTGNFYPVKSLKDVKGHEAYFLNKPKDLRNLPRLKKDAILHQANALMGPFGLAYGNDKRRRAAIPYGSKPNYVHLARFLNALPQTKTFLNNKEKLLATLHSKKRRTVPDEKVVKKHYKRRRKARVIRKKIKRKLRKKVKIPKDDDKKGGSMIVDDTSDEGGVFDTDSEVDLF